MPDLPAYVWSENRRQFRDSRGRFVSRSEVRGALDTHLDSITADIRDATQSLVDGRMSIEGWHGRMEAAIKEAHVSAGAIAAGGWKQATSADWAQVGRKVQAQYRYLRQFARDLENGLPLGPAIVARAQMYGISATGTYEAILRRGDIASGVDLERRILNGVVSCGRCVAHAARGWQPAGVLPGIGEDCDCLSNCRCTFERKRSNPPTRTSRAMDQALTARRDRTIAFARRERAVMFARGGGAKSGKKGKAKAKGATQAKAAGNCGTGAGGFKAGNSCGAKGGARSAQKAAANRVKERLAAKSKGANLDKAARDASNRVEATRRGVPLKDMIAARSQKASVMAARAKAADEKKALEKRHAKNAKARERRAAARQKVADAAKAERAASTRESRAPAIRAMVEKSRVASGKAGAENAARKRAAATKETPTDPAKARRLQAEADKDVRKTGKAVEKAKSALTAAKQQGKQAEAKGVIGVLERQKAEAAAKVSALKQQRDAAKPITPVKPPPAKVEAKPITDPVRLKAEAAKFDQAFDKVPGAGDNFVKLADVRKAMPHLGRDEFDTLIRKEIAGGEFTLEPHEGAASRAPRDVLEGGISFPSHGGGHMIMAYVSRRR